MDWNNTSAHVSEMTSKTELWGTDAKLSAFGEQRKPRKGLRWTSPQLTYCDESTGSGNASLVAESIFRVISETIIENKAFSIWWKHNNTPFSLIWSRFGWTLNKWSCVCVGQKYICLFNYVLMKGKHLQAQLKIVYDLSRSTAFDLCSQ